MKNSLLGIFLLLMVVIFIGCSSDSKTNTSNGVTSSNETPSSVFGISSTDFEQSIHYFEDMIVFLRKDDIRDATTTFYKGHDFLHELDPSLRKINEQLATSVWDATSLVESELEKPEPDVPILTTYSESMLELLKQAKHEMLPKK